MIRFERKVLFYDLNKLINLFNLKNKTGIFSFFAVVVVKQNKKLKSFMSCKINKHS